MKVWVRRTLAGTVGIITLVIVGLWSVFGSLVISGYVDLHLALGVPLSQAGGPRPDSYDASAHSFYTLLINSLLLCAGATSALMVLVPRQTFRARAFVYLMFLAVLLPASTYNYTQGDHVLPAVFQAGLNLIVIFLGATIALSLATFEAKEPDVRVLKYMCMVLVLFGAVLVPGLFTLLWAMWRVGLIGETTLGWAQLTGTGGLASAIIAWLNYRREINKERAARQPPPGILDARESHVEGQVPRTQSPS